MNSVFFAFFLCLFAAPVFAQNTKSDAVTCYKDVLKEPQSFYGNPGDTFTLYNNASWRVSSGGPYEYTPMRFKDVIICPSLEKLMIGNRALSISKLGAH